MKISNYAVINLNNMFPVPDGQYSYVDIRKEKEPQYKALLQAEYRIIKLRQERILKNAEIVYRHKIKNGDSTLLARRCNDFKLLEDMCNKFVK